MADYESLRQAHIGHFFGLLIELVQRLSWPREQIDDAQLQGLRRIIAVAREKSAWHRARLGHITVDTLTRADLAALPVMTKDDLMMHWNEIVTDPRLNLDVVNRHLQSLTADDYLLDSYHAVASGGSSGRRGVFVWDWDSWATACAGSARWSMRHGASQPQPEGGVLVMASVAAENATHMSSAMTQTFSTPLVSFHRFPVTLPMKEIVARLNALQPHGLAGYSSALYELAHEAQRGRLTITPLTVSPNGEPLLPEMRAAMERAWGAPVGGQWGTSEGCCTGQSCYFDRGLHLAEDLLIVEPVDENGKAVPVGETSAKIYLTNLMNHALPLIRYEITDRVRILPEPCACGSSFARIDDIQGRVEEVFRYKDGVSVFPHVFGSQLSRHPHIVEYQVHQKPNGADILVRTAEQVDLNALADLIAAHVAKAGLANPAITVRCVPTIERTAAGKLKRYISLH